MLNNGTILQQRYKIVKILGHGGMGAVYLAEDQRLPTKWAIKEMKKEGLSEEEMAEAAELFQTEARLLSDMRHRNLPRIVDFFEQDQQLYLVMDFVEGQTLEQRMAESGPLSVPFALELCLQITDVLDFLHTRKNPVVFRDFKPGNVMLTPNDEVKLIDFGIARVFKKDASADTKALGTPGYAAPEQYGRGQSGPRTDLFAFGATIHHALTGRDPTDEPFHFPPLSDFRKDLPPEFSAMLESCLSLKPDGRPESAFAIKRLLEQLLGKAGSAALTAGRATTTQLDAGAVTAASVGTQPMMAPVAHTQPISSTAATSPTAPMSPQIGNPALDTVPPKVQFSPKTLTVKELGSGEKATLRLKIKTDKAIQLAGNSPHLQIFPAQVGPGSTTCTITVDSTNLDLGSVFKGAIEVVDFDDLEVPVEARVSAPKASLGRVLGMYALCLLSLVPLLNFASTTIAGVIIFSTPKNRRPSLKLPWRLNLLFTFCWTGAMVAVGMGLSMVDWADLTQQFQAWTSSFG
jgi:serine/threonine protein kinase